MDVPINMENNVSSKYYELDLSNLEYEYHPKGYWVIYLPIVLIKHIRNIKDTKRHDDTCITINGLTKSRNFVCVDPDGKLDWDFRISKNKVARCHGFEINYMDLTDDEAVAIMYAQ
jgi:hypothetical protein